MEQWKFSCHPGDGKHFKSLIIFCNKFKMHLFFDLKILSAGMYYGETVACILKKT